jgi:hypothetical protein
LNCRTDLNARDLTSKTCFTQPSHRGDTGGVSLCVQRRKAQTTCGVRNLMLLAALLSTSAVCAADLSVYGFTLGEPISIPECERGLDPKYVRDACARVFSATAGSILLATSDKPKYWKHVGMEYRLIDGNLALLTVTTTGSPSQRTVYRSLVEKYGKPTRSTVEEKSNAMGAKYESIIATWELPDVTVQFYGLLGRVDTGLLMVGTPAGMDEYLKSVANAANKGKKL